MFENSDKQNNSSVPEWNLLETDLKESSKIFPELVSGTSGKRDAEDSISLTSNVSVLLFYFHSLIKIINKWSI